MIYIIDTYAWVEYFINSKQGLKLKRLFEDKHNKFITMECCLSELKCYCLKNEYNFNEALNIIKTNSTILPIMLDIWLSAADIRYVLRKNILHFGLIDAILVAKQKELNCKVISGDPHFKTLKNVVFMG